MTGSGVESVRYQTTHLRWSSLYKRRSEAVPFFLPNLLWHCSKVLHNAAARTNCSTPPRLAKCPEPEPFSNPCTPHISCRPAAFDHACAPLHLNPCPPPPPPPAHPFAPMSLKSYLASLPVVLPTRPAVPAQMTVPVTVTVTSIAPYLRSSSMAPTLALSSAALPCSSTTGSPAASAAAPPPAGEAAAAVAAAISSSSSAPAARLGRAEVEF